MTRKKIKAISLNSPLYERKYNRNKMENVSNKKVKFSRTSYISVPNINHYLRLILIIFFLLHITGKLENSQSIWTMQINELEITPNSGKKSWLEGVWDIARYNFAQHVESWHTRTHLHFMTHRDSAWDTVTHRDTPWHTVTHRDTPWHTMTHHDTPWHTVIHHKTRIIAWGWMIVYI